MRLIRWIVIHTPDTPFDCTAEQILEWHMAPPPRGNGWRAPGYHRLYRKNGKRYDLWPIEKIANGVKYHNEDSIHICVSGDGDVQRWTPEQTVAIIPDLADLVTQFPGAVVVGHREFYKGHPKPKTCPGILIDCDVIRIEVERDLDHRKLLASSGQSLTARQVETLAVICHATAEALAAAAPLVPAPYGPALAAAGAALDVGCDALDKLSSRKRWQIPLDPGAYVGYARCIDEVRGVCNRGVVIAELDAVKMLIVDATTGKARHAFRSGALAVDDAMLDSATLMWLEVMRSEIAERQPTIPYDPKDPCQNPGSSGACYCRPTGCTVRESS